MGPAGGGMVLGSIWLDEVRSRWGERVVGPDETVMVGRGRGWEECGFGPC